VPRCAHPLRLSSVEAYDSARLGAVRRVVALCTALTLGCGSIPEGRLRCSTELECPNGWSCVEGRCYSTTAIDAGRSDAGRRDGGAEDGGPTLDAGPTDAGPRDAGPTGPLNFGRPSAVIDVLTGDDGVYASPWLSTDGRRLYFIGPPGATPYVASRGSVAEHFSAPQVLAVTNWSSFSSCPSATWSTSELVMFASCDLGGGDLDIYRAERALPGEPFGPLVRVDAASIVGNIEMSPFLSSDGTELFFVYAPDQALVRSQIQDGVVSSPEPVSIDLQGGTGADAPFLTDDGLTLVFSRLTSTGDQRLAMATRAAAGSLSFGPLTEIPAPLNEPTFLTTFPFVSEETDEIFFVSNRLWSPGRMPIWRAHVCRGSACDDPVMTCSGASTRLSPDGRHCYIAFSDAVSWEAARQSCALFTGGSTVGHLLTLHTTEEADLLLGLFSELARVWTAGSDAQSECNLGVAGCRFAWETTAGQGDEPFFAEAGTWVWLAGEPDNGTGADVSDCVAMLRTTGSPVQNLQDDACTAPHAYVCEHELWPWW
jgi:hypothetical protein